MKVASKGLVKTLIPYSEISCKTILYIQTKTALTHPPDNQNLNLFLIICILNGKKEEEIWLLGLSMPTPINEMLSFHFSRFSLSQSHGSRREREFCPLNLEVRDESKIFYQYLRTRDETEILSFRHHVSRWDFETKLTKFSREFSRSRNLAMHCCLANTNK